MKESFRFDIYLNDDLFMHIYDLDQIKAIIDKYETTGYKVKVFVFLWGSMKKIIARAKLYSTDDKKIKENEPINDSAFI